MAEFCECGSLIVDGRCSNKKCALRGSDTAVSPKRKAAGTKTSGRSTTGKNTAKAAAPKKANPRRASRVITYNLYDLKKDDPGKDTES